MAYYVYRCEGGLTKKREGPFDDETEANEVCDQLNEKISIMSGGFEVFEEDEV